MKKILYIIAAGAMLLASCSKENSSPNVDDTAVRFSTEITTRASGTAWDANDQIGVFMKTAGGDISTSEILNASNVKYSTDGTNFTTTTPIYYPQSGAVDFVAYYPYRTTPATDPYIYKVDVITQTTPAAIDLLWSANAKGKTKSTTAVPLVFDHKLSRIVLNIKAGIGMTDADLAGVTVKITGMPTKADFKLATGEFATPTAVANITPIVATTTEGYVATYTAIVVPQKASAWTARKMVFTAGADEYECPIPNEDNFESGKNYAYTIMVEKTGVSVSQGTITDWTVTTGTPGDLGEAEDIIKKYNLVKIPAGTFLMGSSDGSNIDDLDGSGLNTSAAEPKRDGDETQHRVTLTKDFYMSKYTITNTQYAAFLNANSIGADGKWTLGDYPTELLIVASGGSYDWGLHYNIDKWEPVSGYENHPVINVTWYGAKEYARWIGGSLPTEAQWEYACRGDYTDKATTTATLPFGLGDGRKLVLGMANYYIKYSYDLDYNPPGHYNVGDNTGSVGKTTPAGSYASNNYGLYDMHGNVLEWCLDNYMTKYQNLSGFDPVNPPTGNNSGRVLRGGYWNNLAYNCRSASRNYSPPNDARHSFGFRVVFVP